MMKKRIIKRILIIALVMALPLTAVFHSVEAHGKQGTDPVPAISDFEQAVALIKKYETLHQPRHWPLIGYGHLVQKGEKYSRTKALSEREADALLRKDLLKNCAVFRDFGKDSLLLGVLAYNIGPGATLKSTVVKKLRAGDREIRENYLAHCRYRGKVHRSIQARRAEEFELLFEKEDKTGKISDDTAFAVEESMIASILSSFNNMLFDSEKTPFGRLLAGMIAPSVWFEPEMPEKVKCIRTIETNTTACIFK